MMRLLGLTPIGIDIGRHAIKAVQCAGASGGPRLAAAVCLARSGDGTLPDRDEARRLAEVLWRQGFQGRRAVVAVPEAAMLTALVETPPPAPGVPIAQIAASEIARLHNADPTDLECDFWALPPVGPKGTRHEAVAVAVPRADMLALLDALQHPDGGGLDVIAADAPQCARTRAAQLEPRASAPWALLDLGWSAARLGVVADGVIVYDRALPDAGMSRLELRLEQECSLKPEDVRHVLGRPAPPVSRRITGAWRGVVADHAARLAESVQDSLRYLALHRAMEPPRSVLLVGGGAESAPVVHHLAESLDAEAAPISLRRHTPAGQAPRDTGPGLTTAMGLALWAA